MGFLEALREFDRIMSGPLVTIELESDESVLDLAKAAAFLLARPRDKVIDVKARRIE